MIMIAVSACGLGWVVHRAREERLAVQAILAQGGTVEYDYQYDAATNRRIPQGKTWRPVWLQKALGDEYFHNVVCVGLDHVATDANLVHIARLTHLKLLYLGEGRITDQGLKHLENLTDLRLLIVSGSPISGDGLEHLRRLRKLKHLDLGRTEVTDSRLIGLRNLAGLERIDLPNNPQLTGSFLQYVVDLPDLKDLVLRGTGINDAALIHLKHVKKLRALMLDGTRVTDAGLPDLRGLTSLRSLDLTGTAVTDMGIVRICEWLPQTSVKPLVAQK